MANDREARSSEERLERQPEACEGVVMTGGHRAFASEAGPIQRPVTEAAVAGGALEGMMEFVPGYERRRPRGLAPPQLGLEARAPVEADEVLRPPGVGPVLEAAFEPETLYDAASLLPILHLETVIGTDDRTLITPTTEAPWRAICALRITTNRGERLVGTGWLIDPHTVVTAGHCVYSHDLGGWMASVEVIPALDGVERPFGSVIATRLRAVEGWIEDRSPEYDYGAILLDRPIELQGDYFTPMALPDEALEGILVNIAGYPADREQARRMYFHARRAQDIGARRLQYDVDTFGGQSGSSAWVIYPDGKRVVVGIHTNGISPGVIFNSGVRITPEVLCNLQRWSAEAAPRQPAEVTGGGTVASPSPETPAMPSPETPATPSPETPAPSEPVRRPSDFVAEVPPGAPGAGQPETPDAPVGGARGRTVTVEGPRLRLTGRVVDSAGSPVSGATVAISAGSVPYPEIAATSAEDGSFALPITLPGRYEVSVFPGEDSVDAGVRVVPDAPGSAASATRRGS